MQEIKIATSSFSGDIPNVVEVGGICYIRDRDEIGEANTSNFFEYNTCDACSNGSPAPAPNPDGGSPEPDQGGSPDPGDGIDTIRRYPPCDGNGSNVYVESGGSAPNVIRIGGKCYGPVAFISNTGQDLINSWDEGYVFCSDCFPDTSPIPVSPQDETCIPTSCSHCTNTPCQMKITFSGVNTCIEADCFNCDTISNIKRQAVLINGTYTLEQTDGDSCVWYGEGGFVSSETFGDSDTNCEDPAIDSYSGPLSITVTRTDATTFVVGVDWESDDGSNGGIVFSGSTTTTSMDCENDPPAASNTLSECGCDDGDAQTAATGGTATISFS